MGERGASQLSLLIALSKVDAELTRIAADRKKIETEIITRENLLRDREAALRERRRILDEKGKRYSREERAISDERQKLVERRKALSSFTQYKVQEAAAREIDFTAESLNAQEESLLVVLSEIQALEAETRVLDEEISKERDELAKLQEEGEATLATLNERENLRRNERENLAKTLTSQSLAIYTKVKERIPTSAVVPVQKNLCSGCFMQLIPQVLVQISRGEALVRCPGCGRILFIDESK